MSEKADPTVIREVMRLILGRLDIAPNGTDSNTVLAKRMRWTAERPNVMRSIRAWRVGEHGPSFAPLMAMLSEAGLLAPEADAIWRGTSDPDPAGLGKAAAREVEAHLRAVPGSRRRRKRASG